MNNDPLLQASSPQRARNPHEPPADSRAAISMYLETAMDAIRREDYETALETLNRAIVDARDVQLAECYSLRGFVRLKLEQFELAEDDCSEATRRRGNDPETLAWRAAARAELGKWRGAFSDLQMASQADDNKGSVHLHTLHSWLPRALADLESHLVSSASESIPFLYDRGWVYLLANRLEQARQDFGQVLKLDPLHGGAGIGLARVALQETDFATAVRMASQAMQADPESVNEALACRAEAYARQGQLSLAIEDVTRLREKTGDATDGLLLCASLRERLGDVSGAIGDLDIALRLKPDLPVILAARGDAYARIRNYEMALADYTHYLEYVPGDERVWLKRADIHLQLGQVENARAGYDRALEIDDICAAAYLGRCKVMTLLNDYSQGLLESERALRLDSRNPETWVLRGRMFHEQGRHQQAEADFGRAIELSDDPVLLGEVHFRRGISRYESDKPHQAIDDFRLASGFRPTHAGTHIWLAATCARLEEWQEVIDNLHAAIRLRPSAARQYRKLGAPVARKAIEHFETQIREGNTSPDVYRHRGRAHEFLGKNEAAVVDYTAALGSENADPETLIARARLYAKLGDHERSRTDVSRVIRNDHSNHQAYYARAATHLETGDLSAAARDIARAIELAPTVPRYHVLQGDVRLLGGNPKLAINDYSQAIVLDPADHLAFRKRGNCFQRDHNHLLAIADLTRSLELFPALAETLILRGQTYLKCGQYHLASADFEHALKIDPRQVRAFVGQANCMAHDGNHEEALIWLTKAFQWFNHEPRNLAELLMMRGKIFYQMGRFLPAIADFTAVIELQASDRFGVAAARSARAIALVQQGDLIRAKKEFDRVLKSFPDHPLANAASRWLGNGQGTRPEALLPPTRLVRPTRPPVITSPHEPGEYAGGRLGESADSPLKLWLVRTGKPREYGPITKSVLDDWVRQGRIDAATKLLKSGWKKWCKAKRVYPDLVNPDAGKKQA
jgi:tetratricopeptide (TPR) repeat protein